MKRLTIYIAILAAVVCSSCSDWLNVQPSDRVSEEQNFSTAAGFKQALNGIYIELNSTILYGENLSCGFLEILAQRYDISAESTERYHQRNLNFTDASTLSTQSAIWEKMYNLISNANKILENLETHRDVLSSDMYHMIRGEALALRALLHFDLYRMFGDSPALDVTSAAIPYYTAQQFNVAPTLTGEEVMQHVVADLLEAETELANDPILTYGIDGDPKETFYQFRNLRLNIYAVQTLLARAYHYMSGTAPNAKENESEYAAKACEYARKIVALQPALFPWTDSDNTLKANPDRVFSSELIFALQNSQRGTLFTRLFDANNITYQSVLASRSDVVNRCFGYDTPTDYRRVVYMNNTRIYDNVSYSIFSKYQTSTSNSTLLHEQMIPMIRVTEPFAILVELSSDDEERTSCWNAWRNARGLVDRPITDFDMYYPYDYYSETWGEGQLFYWYKRYGFKYMLSATAVSMLHIGYNSGNGAFSVVSAGGLEKYKFDIPEDETQYN